jgi:pimeloyl-ACP methyl ester carboxylesterase
MTCPPQPITIAVTEHLHIDQGVMMRVTTLSRRTAGVLATLGLLSLLLAFPLRAAAAANGDPTSAGPKPTIVLVHGGWADASSWDKVARRLQDHGYPVIAPANPLRGVQSDSAYLSSVLATIPGPIVLVGHSYGGVLITNAATGNPNVKALVYVAAFAPDERETVGQILAMNPGSKAAPPNLTFRPYPGGVDVYITPSAFHNVFCADLPATTAAVMAATQRPIDAAALGEPSGVPAWKTIPSWYLVASNDQAIPPATERFMAKRAGATTVEIASSHVAMISHPGVVTDLVVEAAHAVD